MDFKINIFIYSRNLRPVPKRFDLHFWVKPNYFNQIKKI